MKLYSFDRQRVRVEVADTINRDLLDAAYDQAVPLSPKGEMLSPERAAAICSDNIALVGVHLADSSVTESRPKLSTMTWRAPKVGHTMASGSSRKHDVGGDVAALRDLYLVPVPIDLGSLAVQHDMQGASLLPEYVRRLTLVGTILDAAGVSSPRAMDIVAGIRLPHQPADTRVLFMSVSEPVPDRLMELSEKSETVIALRQRSYEA